MQICPQNARNPILRPLPVTYIGIIGILSCLGCSAPNPAVDNRLIHNDSSAVVGPLIDLTQAPESMPDDAASLASENMATEKIATTTPEYKSSKSPASTPLRAQPRSQLTPRSTVSSEGSENPTAALQKAKATEARQSPAVAATVDDAPSATLNSAPAAPAENVANRPVARVSGKVHILGDENERIQITGSIVTLVPRAPFAMSKSSSAPKLHRIDMQNKTYLPRFLSIQKHDQVAFVNKDEIKHNVFSSSGKNAFDLGTYGAGKQRVVALGESGIVKVYCNIHSEMATFIAVNEYNFSVVTDADGGFEFNDISPGSYEIQVWHVRGEKKIALDISAGESRQLELEVDTSTFNPEHHKNKFGKTYTTNSALFDDEFY